MAAEFSKFIADVDSVWRQIFEPRMLDEYPNVSGAAYPSQFKFAEKNGRRVESVIWGEASSVEACHELGVLKAERDATLKKEKKPDLPEDEIPRYVGFFPALVGRVRGSHHQDEFYCEPGVFDVEHEPENGVHAHSHIVLLDGFLEIIRVRMEKKLGPKLAAVLDQKKARQHAINMLVGVVEHAGLTRSA